LRTTTTLHAESISGQILAQPPVWDYDESMKKMLTVIVLVLLGFYWLLDHAPPLPLNHEMFDLYNHDVHRAIGFVCFFAAALVAWKWKSKKG